MYNNRCSKFNSVFHAKTVYIKLDGSLGRPPVNKTIAFHRSPLDLVRCLHSLVLPALPSKPLLVVELGSSQGRLQPRSAPGRLTHNTRFLTARVTVPSRYLEGARSGKTGEAQKIRTFSVLTHFPSSPRVVQKAEHGSTVIGEVKVRVSTFPTYRLAPSELTPG